MAILEFERKLANLGCGIARDLHVRYRSVFREQRRPLPRRACGEREWGTSSAEMVIRFQGKALLSPSYRIHQTVRSLTRPLSLRYSSMMARASTTASESAIDDLRRSEGQGSASSQVLADEAIIWASLHGLVQLPVSL